MLLSSEGENSIISMVVSTTKKEEKGERKSIKDSMIRIIPASIIKFNDIKNTSKVDDVKMIMIIFFNFHALFPPF